MELFEVNRGRLVWWILGSVLAVSLLFVAYSFVGTLVFGIFIYYATRPIYRQIRRATNHPNVAAAISLFALVLPALLLVAYAVTIVMQELARYAKTTNFDPARFGIDPSFLNRIADPAALLQGGLGDYLTGSNLAGLVGSIGSAFGTVAVLGIALVHLFVMLALAFYLLRDDHRLSRWFYHSFGDDKGVVQTYVRAVDRDFNAIFFGNILNAVLTGTIGVIAYSALNVFAPPELSIPAPALLGLLAGAASLIPVVGMKLVYVPVAILLFVQALLLNAAGTLTFVAAFVLVSFIIVDTIPDLVLRPYVSGRSLHVGAVMLAYTLGPLLFGWYGIFLMPMLLVLVVHFARIVLPELLSGSPVEPYAVDPASMTAESGTPGADDAGAATDGYGEAAGSLAGVNDPATDAATHDDGSSDTDEALPGGNGGADGEETRTGEPDVVDEGRDEDGENGTENGCYSDEDGERSDENGENREESG